MKGKMNAKLTYLFKHVMIENSKKGKINAELTYLFKHVMIENTKERQIKCQTYVSL